MNQNYYWLGSRRDTRLKEGIGSPPTSSASTPQLSWLSGLLLLVCSLFMSTGAMAQINQYVFSQSSGTYTALSASRTIVFTATAGATADPGLGDDQNYTLPAGTIPFSFLFNATAYTGVNINSNGFLTFGATLPTSSDRVGLSNTTAYSGAIAIHGLDMSANTNALNLGEISYEILGSAPNRQFVIQYAKWRRFSSASTFTENFNFQIVLNETTNTINMIYGAATATGAGNAQVGLRGVNNTFNPNVINRTGNWATTTAGTTNSSVVTHSAAQNPVSGLTFTWTPPVPPTCGVPTGLAVSDNINGTTVDLAWTAPSIGTPASYDWEIRTSGAGGSGATGRTSFGNSLTNSVNDATGLTPATAYNLYVRTNCTGGNGSSTWAGPTAFNSAQICPSGLGAGSVSIASLPYSASGLTNSGAGNNVTATNVACVAGSTSYYGALDKTYSFVAPATGTYSILLTTATDDDAGIMLYQGCPFTTGSTCVAFAQSTSGLTRTLTPSLTSGLTYYLVVDNFPAPAFIGTYSLSIAAPTPCDGTTTAGTIAPTSATLCPAATQLLTATGASTIPTGLSYLWEVSLDGTTGWTAASGTNNALTYTATDAGATRYYRFSVTCSNNSTTYSSNVSQINAASSPTTQITNFSSTAATATSISLGWTNGSGNNRSIFISNTNSFVDPVNGSAPGTVNTVYGGSGQQLLFDGTGTSVTVTGLTAGTTYYFRAYESLKCTSPSYFYNTTGTSISAGTLDKLKYTIARSSATYTPVSGAATVLSTTTGVQDDTNYGAVTFFPFVYSGATVTQFRAVTNGFMTLNATNTNTSFNNGLTNATGNNFVLAPFWEDLYVNNGTPNSQFVKYEITGSAPNRVLTVQWENLELFNYPGPSLNFQVKLYETTNVIEYVYGVMQGFDGTNPNVTSGPVPNGLAFSYTVGMTTSTWGTPALAGEAIGLQQANSLSFTSLGGITTNEGLNKLSVLPECNTKYIWTPAGTIRPNDAAPGLPSPPVNDNPAGAVALTALPTVPANFCGSFYSSAFATPTSGVAAPIASTLADDDVWFKFTAISTNTTITLRGSGGYDAAMQLFDATSDPTLATPIASKNVNSMAGTSLTETINGTDVSTLIGDEYYVRVYHAGGGTQATATATVSGGAITGFTITNGGSGYITCYGGAGITATPFVYITDATGAGAVAKMTVTGGAVTAIALQGSQGGSGYSATPTVTVASPSYGVTGDFSIIVNATPSAPANDEICNAVSLNVNATCTTTSGFTFGATASSQAVCAGNADDDVWYSFVASVSNPTITLNGIAAGFDGRIQVLSSSDNTCTGTLASVFCQSNVGGGSPEILNTSGLTIGNTYFVRVYHNGLGSGSGNFTICVTATAPSCLTAPTSPADAASTCAGLATTLSWPAAAGATAYTVVLDGNTVSTNQSGLTYSAGILSAGTHTWSVTPSNFIGAASGCPTWSFGFTTPATPGTISGPTAIETGASYSYSETGGSGFASLQWKYSTTPGGPYINITGATTATTSLTPNVGGTLYLVLAYVNSSCEVYSNELTIVITLPPGEACSDAIVLPLNTAVTTGNLAAGGSNVDVLACGFNTPGNERYYTFTSTFAGTYTLDITNVNGGFGFNDYFFKVAAGTPDCDLATGWSCIDDNSGVGTDTFTLAANTTYYLLVDAESAASTANHTFRIIPPTAPNCVASPTAPANGSLTVSNCSPTLSWPAVATATGYDVYFDAGTSATTLVSSNQAGTTYAPGLLVSNTAYAWRVVPRNGVGPATGCADFTFSTVGTAPACIALPTSPSNNASICGVGAVTFSWPASSGATSYSLVIDGGAPIVQAGTTYTTPGALADGTHTWSVTPSNCNGTPTGCATWTFTSAVSPAGDTFLNPVLLGNLTASVSIGGETTSSCWTDAYHTGTTPAPPANSSASKDIFYKFDIVEASTLAIGTCTSSFDTYIHLLDSTGARINFDDDTCATPNSLGSYLSNLQLAIGTYYVVIEGHAGANGTYTLAFDYVSNISTAPTGATASPSTICVGDGTTLSVQGGSLAPGASWHWYSGSCGGTPVDTGATIDVFPTVTTTYYVRAEGANTTTCAQVTVTVNQITTFYVDADLDGFGDDTDTTESCVAPEGYVAVGGDCNDADNTFYPGAPEVCWNGILENCTGTLSQGCAPVVVNMAPSYNNTTLSSLSQAIPAVPYSYGGFTNLKYRFSITNVTTGAVSADIIQTSRYINIPAALHSYPGAYDIKVSAVINEEIVPFAGNTIRVNAPALQLVTLSTASCGATLATLASTLTANPGPNATGYTFRIRLNDANPTPTYATSQSATRFIGANTFTGFPLQYASSYKVSVSYTYTDPVTSLPVESPYGAECTVNTPSIPLIGMASPTCGSTVTAMNANMSAQAASYATGYRFRIRLFADNGPTPTYYYTLPNASRFSSLTAFQGITLAYSTAYSISAEYSILNGSTTVWSGFGADCKVTTPFFPTTSLVPSQCGQPTATSLTQQLNITPYPGFPNYRVLLEEVNGEDVLNSQELIVPYSYFRLNQFSIAQPGKNYNVSVAIKQNGVFGNYSTACDLFTAPLGKTEMTVAFTATAYPNPFADNFMIDVKSASQSNVSIKVYDMIGRMIEQRDVRVSDMESTTIGNSYPSGVYNVVVSQEDSVQTVRVVKR